MRTEGILYYYVDCIKILSKKKIYQENIKSLTYGMGKESFR